ncbi:MAG: type 4a pilus biogenesis protein PilO [Phycisphaerae bacterium]|nr:type 4a pilus biogenesis protein PilO [Phycisphaerae bacterium]
MKVGIRLIVFVVLLMMIPLAAWWLVFRPADLYKAQMLEQVHVRQERLRELNQATAMLGDLKLEIAALEKAIGFFQSKLPSEKEIDKVLREVWRLAETNHLVTKSIRTLPVDEKTASATPREQPIAVQLEGDFRGFYGFLQALENQPRIMRINSMTVGKLKNASEGQVEAIFNMSIFFERAPTAPL